MKQAGEIGCLAVLKRQIIYSPIVISLSCPNRLPWAYCLELWTPPQFSHINLLDQARSEEAAAGAKRSPCVVQLSRNRVESRAFLVWMNYIQLRAFQQKLRSSNKQLGSLRQGGLLLIRQVEMEGPLIRVRVIIKILGVQIHLSGLTLTSYLKVENARQSNFHRSVHLSLWSWTYQVTQSLFLSQWDSTYSPMPKEGE